jgi:hypothetical protein
MKFFGENIISWWNFGKGNVQALSEFFPVIGVRELGSIISKKPVER